jgi:hypothetical protein
MGWSRAGAKARTGAGEAIAGALGRGREAKAAMVSGATRRWLTPESRSDSKWWIVPSSSRR